MDGLEGNMGQSTRDGCCAESDVEKAEFLGSESDGVELKVCGDGKDGRKPSWVWYGGSDLGLALRRGKAHEFDDCGDCRPSLKEEKVSLILGQKDEGMMWFGHLGTD
ncbi:hypothetical protein M0R45_000144 [Rubus argutus]|uniref:Uncharacterized protein n=1 Tax=Rubus argutus TaxID=59490 RepID=A0AAW1VR35_RUBAR